MATSSERPLYCPHKDETNCTILRDKCCKCADSTSRHISDASIRAHSARARFSLGWSLFCTSCKAYWARRANFGLTFPSDTRPSSRILALPLEGTRTTISPPPHSNSSDVGDPDNNDLDTVTDVDNTDQRLENMPESLAHHRTAGSSYLRDGTVPLIVGNVSNQDDSDYSDDDLRSLFNIPSSSNGSSGRRSTGLWSLSNSAHDPQAEIPGISGSLRRFVITPRAPRIPRGQVVTSSRNPSQVAAQDEDTDAFGRRIRAISSRAPRPQLDYNPRFRALEEEELEERIRQGVHMGREGVGDESTPVALSQRSLTAHNRAQRRRLDGSAPGRTSRAAGPLFFYEDALARITFPNTAEDRLADRALERARIHQQNLPAGYSGINGSRWRGSRRPLDGRPDLAPSHEPKGLDADETRPKPLEMDQMKLDCECKICFGQIADTLLLPCNHLAICSWCANQMGIRYTIEPYPTRGQQVQCPVCRTSVSSKIKVYRA